MNLRRLYLFGLIVLIISLQSHSQINQFTVQKEFTQYNPGLTKFKLPDNEQNAFANDLPQLFIYNRGQILMQPDGTGRLYRLFNKSNNLNLFRLDSTIFYGATFGCYLFSYNDSIYSLGGYGYWKYNGLLRVFVAQKGEWELEKLNREIPVSRLLGSSNPVWLNSNKGELWLTYSINHKEGIKTNGKSIKSIVDSVFVLDLRSKGWVTKGHLNDSVFHLLNTIETKPLASSPWGQLVYSIRADLVFLINYTDNQLMRLTDAKASLILKLMSTNSILHFVDSSLVIQSGDNWLKGNFSLGDTVSLNINDFHRTNIKVFAPAVIKKSLTLPVTKPIDYKLIFIGFIIGSVICSTILALIIYQRRNQRKRLLYKENSSVISYDSYFDERERDLINLIKTNSLKGMGTSIDDVNKTLGVTSKGTELQKKHRSEVLISINDKWSKFSNSSGVLIQKRRLDFDKRSYEYYIRPEDLDLFS